MNKDIQLFENEVNQLRVKTKAKLQQTVFDLKTDLSQLRLDHQRDTEPLNRKISELQAEVQQLQTDVSVKEQAYESKRSLVEKKIEVARKDLERFGKTPGRTTPNMEKEFECPVCLEMMGPPRKIFQCPSGHLLCDVCKTHTHERTCHVCRVQLAGGFTRSLAMERVVRTYLGENSK